MIATGAPLLLVALAAAGAAAWAGATNYNWYPLAPDWLLEDLADSPSRARAANALTELSTRLADSKLAGERADRLIARALEIQADPQGPWLEQWGDLIDAGLQTGRLDTQQFESYAANGVRCALNIRDRVRAGETNRIVIMLSPYRFGAATSGKLDAPWPSILLDGEPLMPGEARGGVSFGFAGAGSLASSATDTTISAPLGEHQLRARLEITTLLLGLPAQYSGHPVTTPLDISAKFELVPPDTALIEFVDDPSIAPQMAAAITVPKLTIVSETPDATLLDGEIRCRDLPMPFACEIFIRDAGGVLLPWRRACLPAGSQASQGFSDSIEGRLGDTADIVLRASERAALDSPAVDSSWQGEIVIENVPVTRPDADPPG